MKTAQAKIQKFGSLLSAMVMPNIGVFIGWGLLTALFIDTGWTPNAYLNKLVSPILTYLLPCLIGYTAGSNIYGRRGGVIGAFATMGAVVGADVTMLVAGMILGPVAAICIRAFDKAVEGKVKPGLEMLVDNFSLGIIGFVICIIGYVGVAPIMTAIQTVLTGGVQYLTDHNMLPLTELFVQPAEILFLNNAINHGIMTPLGLQQAAEAGKSVLFLVEASGAAWVGLSLAFAIFGNKSAKKSAPGAVIIMFFGGIAEVCFPYCLTMPLTIIGPILGNMFSLFVLTNFGGGVVGPVSPGSVISYYMMTPKACMLVNTIAYVPDVFCKDNIVLNAKYANKEEAIKACADIFIKGGYTDESYKADMLQRDKEASVYLGNGVALPHGLASSKETIKNSGICFVQVPDGVDFNGEKAYLLVGVAGKGEEHVELLGKIGQSLMDEGVIEKLKNSTSKEEVINLLNLKMIMRHLMNQRMLQSKERWNITHENSSTFWSRKNWSWIYRRFIT